jgi:hypothetical protein
MKLNSVIFHTNRLSEIRDFYEGKLKLPIGTYLKDGNEVSDYSETYVNYRVGSALLCFEIDGDRADMGTVVLNVEDFSEFKIRLENEGIQIVGGNTHYFKIKDPEGRSLIIEPVI